MSVISINNLARAIYDSSKDKSGKELDLFMSDVLRFLIHKRMISKSNLILDKLESIIDKDDGIVRATISTRSKMDKDMMEEIELILKKRYKAKEVIITHIEDKKLLGGVKIEVLDEVIDMTLSNKINQLQTYLNKN